MKLPNREVDSMDKATLIAKPLELARLYDNGKGLLWHTLAEASHVLSKTEPKVTMAQLKHARSLLSLPPQILALFAKVELNTYTRQRLLSAKAKYGVDNLIMKAAGIRPATDDEDRRRILRLLNDDGQHEVRRLQVQSLVAEYRAGLASKRWKNINQASRQLGLRNQLYQAVAVSNLPRPILDLFEAGTLSLSAGKKLAKLVAMYGPNTLVERATWTAEKDCNLSNRQKLTILAASNSGGRPAITVKARRMRKKLVVEFHCPDETGSLAADLDALRLILNVSIATILKPKGNVLR
jgi:hypothetical protein